MVVLAVNLDVNSWEWDHRVSVVNLELSKVLVELDDELGAVEGLELLDGLGADLDDDVLAGEDLWQVDLGQLSSQWLCRDLHVRHDIGELFSLIRDEWGS